MRRTALLGLTLLLPACQNYVSSPFDGFGGFIGNTQTFNANANRPTGDAPNVLRADGQPIELEALTPEPGNVWPGPAAPEPTLEDIERQQNESQTPGEPARPLPRGSSTPPGGVGLEPGPPDQPVPPPHAPPAPPPPSPRFYPTPGGPVVGTQTGNGVQTFTDPKGGMGIVVPNGNGTSTLIGPDGSVTSVPTPR
jgi:hypothetical protein